MDKFNFVQRTTGVKVSQFNIYPSTGKLKTKSRATGQNSTLKNNESINLNIMWSCFCLKVFLFNKTIKINFKILAVRQNFSIFYIIYFANKMLLRNLYDKAKNKMFIQISIQWRSLLNLLLLQSPWWARARNKRNLQNTIFQFNFS